MTQPPSVRRAATLDCELQVPVVIVGAGVCGLVAALTLRDAGVDCVLLERDAQPRGSSALSSGFIPAAATAAQRDAGIADSVDGFAEDIRHKAGDSVAEHLVQAYAAAVGPALDQLQARHGFDWVVLDGFLYPGHRVRRMHAVRERTGAALMQQLERAALAAGATLLTHALVRELWFTPDDQLLGVGFERPDGQIEQVRCRQLLLACNGFGGNPDMVRQWLPEMREAVFAGHVGNDGSAIAWGQQLGAQLADLGGYQGHGSWAVPQGVLISWALMMEGGVQINAQGRRFHDETAGYSEASVAVLAQPGSVAWNVFDAPLLALARTFPDFIEAERAGAVKTCADVDALAQLIGCAPSVLDQTLSGLATAQEDAWGRRFSRPLQPPYFAIRVTGALFHTQGGLAIDEQCRVLRADRSAVPGLLAAGGAARGVSGNHVWGYLSGNGLLSAVAGGAIAAHTMIGALQSGATR